MYKVISGCVFILDVWESLHSIVLIVLDLIILWFDSTPWIMLALVHKPCMFIVFDSFKFLLTYSSIKSPHVLGFFFFCFFQTFFSEQTELIYSAVPEFCINYYTVKTTCLRNTHFCTSSHMVWCCTSVYLCHRCVLSRWCWFSLVPGLFQFRTWCWVCVTKQTASQNAPSMNPAERGRNVRELEVQQTGRRSRREGARTKRRARGPGRVACRGWSSSTALGIRPTRSARTRGCKVIMRDCTSSAFQTLHSLRCPAWSHPVFLCVYRPLDLLRVELKMRKTCFWRHQKGKPDTYLATIEAIYYFLKDFHELCLAREYGGEYDNLLFFYSYLHSVVNKAKTEKSCWNQQWDCFNLTEEQIGLQVAGLWPIFKGSCDLFVYDYAIKSNRFYRCLTCSTYKSEEKPI